MQRNRPPSAQTIKVLRALAADPTQWRYGYELGTEVGLKSGSLCPILVRLADRGLLETSWEPGVGSRPPRHLYRLTGDGRDFVAALTAARTDRTVPTTHIAAVREIIGSISQREFTKGIIVTTSGFTSAARQEAERLGVELYDGERLL